MNINTNNYSIIEIIRMLERRELVVNSSYQRGSGLWPVGACSYFIDTILEDYPFPKIYMYEQIHIPTGEIRKELVDGQQRIKAITRYHNNEFAITGESAYTGLRFDDLDEEAQAQFLWRYHGN